MGAKRSQEAAPKGAAPIACAQKYNSKGRVANRAEHVHRARTTMTRTCNSLVFLYLQILAFSTRGLPCAKMKGQCQPPPTAPRVARLLLLLGLLRCAISYTGCSTYEECRFAKQTDSSGRPCPWSVLIFRSQRYGTAKPGLRDEERGDCCCWSLRSDPGGFHLEVLFDH